MAVHVEIGDLTVALAPYGIRKFAESGQIIRCEHRDAIRKRQTVASFNSACDIREFGVVT
jgi:hypothetical protein